MFSEIVRIRSFLAKAACLAAAAVVGEDVEGFERFLAGKERFPLPPGRADPDADA